MGNPILEYICEGLLIANKDGLFNESKKCFCQRSDIVSCGKLALGCTPGYKVQQYDGSVAIKPERESPRGKLHQVRRVLKSLGINCDKCGDVGKEQLIGVDRWDYYDCQAGQKLRDADTANGKTT